MIVLRAPHGASSKGLRTSGGLGALGRVLACAVLLISACTTSNPSGTAVERHETRAMGASISYSVAPGHGKPLLLLHGWASDSSVWDLLAPRLQSAGPVVAVDAPGTGLSTRGSEAFTYARYADAAVAVMDREGLSSAIVVAHSFGAYAAREFVRRHPERTCAIVLIDGSFGRSFPDTAAVQAFRNSLSAQPWPAPLQARSTPAGASEETLRRIASMRAGVSLASAGEWIDALQDERLYGAEPIAVPVRLIMREESTWMNAEEIDRLRAFAPRLHVMRIPGASHFLSWDAPEEVGDLIDAFSRTVECSHSARQ